MHFCAPCFKFSLQDKTVLTSYDCDLLTTTGQSQPLHHVWRMKLKIFSQTDLQGHHIQVKVIDLSCGSAVIQFHKLVTLKSANDAIAG